MGATKLPRVENVFGLVKRKTFVAYGFWNISIADESEHRAMFLKREEQPGRQLAQAAFAVNLAGIHRRSPRSLTPPTDEP
jgi:hypothetical protein